MLLPIFLASVWAWILAVRIFFRLNGLNLGRGKTRKFCKKPELIVEWIAKSKGKSSSLTLQGALLHKMESLGSNASRADLENTADEVLRWILPETEKELGMLGGLASISPLLGLLGTVEGMIGTFDVIGSFGTSNPAFMADSISVALITTQDALVVALPLLLIHTFLSNKRRQIEDSTQELLHAYLQYKFPVKGSTP